MAAPNVGDTIHGQSDWRDGVDGRREDMTVTDVLSSQFIAVTRKGVSIFFRFNNEGITWDYVEEDKHGST